MTSRAANRSGWGGILAPVAQLDVWLHVAVVALTVASVIRYLSGHGLDGRGPLVLTGALLLIVVYGASPVRRWPTSTTLSYLWCGLLIGAWLVLVILAASFSWVAVPLAFVALRVLPFQAASVAIVIMLAAVIIAWSTMQNRLDPTVVAGPLAVATLAVIAYRSLERESTARRDLLVELQDAQAELAEAQHEAGALSERTRLSREIHDSVAQGLSSINLLLQAAEHRWDTEQTAARSYVRQASLTARDSLDEVRRVVHDLAADELSTDRSGSALGAAIGRACDQIAAGSDLTTELHVHGEPQPISAEVATALVRSVRGAMANVVEHADATETTISLTYQPDSILLDVRDNGRGFDRARPVARNGRGQGLSGIESRVRHFGGQLTVESSPGEGTALAVSIPLDQHT